MKIRPAYAVEDKNRSLINIIITKKISALCGYNEEFLNAKLGSIYSSHWHLKG
jgi:hypothetical protein